MRSAEVFVDVTATSAEHAESEAAKVPGVLSVFAKSALRADGTEPTYLRGEDDEQ